MRTRPRRLARLFLFLLLLLAVLVACAPWFAGTAFVRNLVAERIGAVVGRPVRVGALDAGWKSGIALSGIEIAGGGGEFDGDRPLRVRAIRLSKPLHEIVLGGGPTDIEIDGLELALEERAGGRTSLDDVFARLTAPRPVEEVVEEEEPREPQPLRIALRDCSIRWQRLPYRPPPVAVDPFHDDLPVTAADANALEIALDRFDLELRADPTGTTLAFGGGVTIDRRGGRVRGALAFRDGTVTGKVETERLDLAILAPFHDHRLEGRVDLRAASSDGASVEVAATITGLVVAGEGLPTLDETRLALDAQLGWSGGRIELASLGVESESLDLAATASLRPADWTDAPRFTLRGRAPLRTVLEPFAAKPADGTLRLDVRGDAPRGRLRIEGEATIEELVFHDPELDEAAPASLRARLDVTLDPARRRLQLDRCEIDATGIRFDVTGKTGFEGAPCELSGSAALDLARVRRLAGGMLGLPADATVLGHLRVDTFALSAEARGDFDLRADALARNVRVEGVVREPLAFERGEAHVDLSLSDGGDRLRVRRGEIGGLRVEGAASGLARGPFVADGRVEGTVTLSPAWLRMARVRAVERLAGELTIAAEIATGGDGVRIDGRAEAREFELRVGETTFQPAAIAAEAALLLREGELRGGAVVRADGDRIEIRELIATRRAATATVRATSPDLASSLRRAGFEPPGGLAGDAEAEARVRRVAEGWDLTGSAASAGLTLRGAGFGPRAEPLRVELSARKRPGRWEFADARITLPERRLEVAVPKAWVTTGGVFASTVEWSGEAADLAAIAEPLFALRPTGWVVGSGELGYRGGLRFDGEAIATQLALDVAGRRRTFARARFTARGRETGGHLEITPLRAETAEAFATGRIVVGAKLDYALEGEIAAAALGRRIGEPLAGGRVRWTASNGAGAVSVPRLAHGPVAAEEAAGDWRWRDGALEASWRARRLQVEGVSLLGAEGEFTAAKGGVAGPLRFLSIEGETIEWGRGAARLRYRDDRLDVSDLSVAANGGTLRGGGHVAFGKGPPAWALRLEADRVRLTERFAHPLGLLVPVLRSRPGAGVRGLVSGSVDVRGAGMTRAQLRRTLVGSGRLRFADVEVEKSLLLSVVSLRVDKLITRKPYRFADLVVPFEIRELRVHPEKFTIKGVPFAMRVRGSAGLDGTLDFVLNPLLPPLTLTVTGNWERMEVKHSPLERFR